MSVILIGGVGRLEPQYLKPAMAAARTNDIPVFMHHACGLCTLRECLKCIHIINHKGGSEDA